MATLVSDRVKQLQQRHELLIASTSEGRKNDIYKGRIRDHPRWTDLIGKQEADEKIEGAGEQGPSMGPAYIPAESTVRNDYSQHFVDTGSGQLPGNAVCNPDKSTRFQEYPKLKRLVEIKSDILASISHPPIYMQTDLLNSTGVSYSDSFHLANLLPIKFDVAVIDPPLESYEWESIPGNGIESSQVWSWDQVAALPVPQIMAKESFIFLWVGSGASDGLERGREVLMRWGYRRCEDIVWVQTNKTPSSDDGSGNSMFVPGTSSSCFAKSAQHCLMGIRGTVRRSTDTRFVHCNIDTDVIVWPGEKRHSNSKVIDTRSKPPEMMDLAENFCLGTRRLELFGRNRNLRRGWLTVGLEVGPQSSDWDNAQKGRNACAAVSHRPCTPLPYDKASYDAHFGVDRAGCTLAERINLVPFHEEIDQLRPRSPSHSSQPSVGGNRRGMQPARGTAPMQQQQQHYDPAMYNLAMMMQQGANINHHAGGAGISGLGAGGPAVVSIPSGSEMLSGAQANVLMGQASHNIQPGLSKSRKPM
jgi:N6-adenosine-specific RNA methylase IME4